MKKYTINEMKEKRSKNIICKYCENASICEQVRKRRCFGKKTKYSKCSTCNCTELCRIKCLDYIKVKCISNYINKNYYNNTRCAYIVKMKAGNVYEMHYEKVNKQYIFYDNIFIKPIITTDTLDIINSRFIIIEGKIK